MIINKKNLYLLQQERLDSFLTWKFTEKQHCNKNAMAAAGFFKCYPNDDTNDACACFFCGKTLDAWEAIDDPFKEHKSHSPNCKFINVERPEGQLKLSEFINLFESWCMDFLAQQLDTERDKRTVLFNSFLNEVEIAFKKSR